MSVPNGEASTALFIPGQSSRDDGHHARGAFRSSLMPQKRSHITTSACGTLRPRSELGDACVDCQRSMSRAPAITPALRTNFERRRFIRTRNFQFPIFTTDRAGPAFSHVAGDGQASLWKVDDPIRPVPSVTVTGPEVSQQPRLIAVTGAANGAAEQNKPAVIFPRAQHLARVPR